MTRWTKSLNGTPVSPNVFIQASATDLAGNAMALPFAYDFTIQTRSFGQNVSVDGGTAGTVCMYVLPSMADV